ALPVLEQQTGWKKVIDAVVNAVMNFICPKIAEQSQGKSTYRSFFFANPNPAAKEIEDVEQNILRSCNQSLLRRFFLARCLQRISAHLASGAFVLLAFFIFSLPDF
ncbi:hypothetical protein, partial [Legionella feeleii]|uniref:hypothetical protein n=1 Tax=Legionella feeleii TaxID=453 RepID=UPI0015594072